MAALPTVYLLEEKESFGEKEDSRPKQIGALSELSLSQERASEGKSGVHVDLEQTDKECYEFGKRRDSFSCIETSRQGETGGSQNEHKAAADGISLNIPASATQSETGEKSQREVNQLKRLCAPCSEENGGDGSDVPLAVKYCLECADDICKSCCDMHRKFPALKHHQLIDINAFNRNANIEPSDAVFAPETSALGASPTSSGPGMSPLQSESSELTINKPCTILLIGETGVGKSTFINALGNYLRFPSFVAATSESDPICLISTTFISFRKTVSMVGKNDSTEEKDPNKSGTQKSSPYLFKNQNYKFEIIDTPGLYGTHSSNKKSVFTEVSEFLSQYDHIDGICILLKPDQQKMTNHFMNLLSMLLDYFCEDVIENMVFCFTFAKKFLERRSCDTENTITRLFKERGIKIAQPDSQFFYYVENEAVQYLYAKSLRVRYNETDINNFRDSWNRSKMEMIRMLNHFNGLNKSYDCSDNSLHKYLKLEQQLTKPFREVALAIQENIESSRTEQNKLLTHRLGAEGGEEARKEIEIKDIKLTSIRFSNPRVVCRSGSDKCELLCQTPRSTSGEMESQDAECESESKLLPKEYCVEVKDRKILERIKYHVLWMFGTTCDICKCEYRHHKIATYRIQRDVINSKIISVENRIADLYEELVGILSFLAKLTAYCQLRKHSLLPLDEAKKTYFERELALEKKILKRNMRTMETDKKEIMNKMKALDAIADIFQTKLETWKKSVSNISPSDFYKKQDINGQIVQSTQIFICDLPINGDTLEDLMNAEANNFKEMVKMEQTVYEF